jgi:hypothetical protein
MKYRVELGPSKTSQEPILRLWSNRDFELTNVKMSLAVLNRKVLLDNSLKDLDVWVQVLCDWHRGSRRVHIVLWFGEDIHFSASHQLNQ